MPGLVDVHTHLVFGNARSEEDVDFWATPEFRALRGTFFAQHVLAAGYTSIVVPGDAASCSIAVRGAINAGLFDGPRIAASSNAVANRHSLNDWFPEHVGTPDYMTGSDTGFAVTPYGEWHAREIGILVEWLGLSPAAALRAATSVGAKLMQRGRQGTPDVAAITAVHLSG